MSLRYTGYPGYDKGSWNLCDYHALEQEVRIHFWKLRKRYDKDSVFYFWVFILVSFTYRKEIITILIA